jgi:pyruvate dehydrogenase E2 component (dihydrolipoamide acetyltransferase)
MVEPQQRATQPPTQRPPSDPGAKGESVRRELSRVQEVIARRMAQSKATAPDFVLKMDVDMEAAVALRTQLRGIVGPESRLPSFNDFVIKACAVALREAPMANGSYADAQFVLHGRVNVGIAVAATDSLVVPTIFDADQKSLGEIARVSRRLVEKAHDGTITAAELSGGTFTVSNLGMLGVDEFTAVINPPQAAILAVGAVRQRAVVVDGQLEPRHTMSLSLSCDHRILYGANAAEFLSKIRQALESPGSLVL